jgi:hypothetical protein
LAKDLEPAMRTGATALNGMGPAKLILKRSGDGKECVDAAFRYPLRPVMYKPTIDNFLRARAGDAPSLVALGKERVEASRVYHDATAAQGKAGGR